MTQPLFGADAVGPADPPVTENLRERNRRARRQEFLDVALGIVAAEGISGLTMARVTDQMGCANGSIYYYFATKGTLVAEIQLEALQVLARSIQASQAHLLVHLAQREADADVTAFTRVVVAARFWIDAEQTFPRQIELSRQLFTEPGFMLSDEEAVPVISPTRALFDLAGALLDDAVAHGTLRPGNSMERAVILLAGTTGVLLTSGLRRWDDDLFDGGRLAGTMLHDLLTAWGADPDQLAFAYDVADTMAEQGHLVPTEEPPG